MRRNKQGFTLIELIVVIAVLAILAALAVPSFMGLREDSAAKVCEANREMLYRSYLIRRSLDNGETATQSLNAVKAEFSEEHLCPSGGTYSYNLSSMVGELTITCSEHSGSLHGYNVKDTLSDVIHKLIGDGTLKKSVTRYDSGAIGKTYQEGQGKGESNATKIENALKELGLNSEGTTWSVEMNSGAVSTVCWMEDGLSDADIQSKNSLVIRYDATSNTYAVGRVPIKTQSTIFTESYSYFDNTKFKPDTSFTATTDFNAAHAAYLEAKNAAATQP